MSIRPKKIEVLRLWLLTAVCSGALLSPAGAANVDYFKPAPPQVPPASKPTTKLPAIQKGMTPQFDKSTPKLVQPSTKGGHKGIPPTIVGPPQAPASAAKGQVFPKVEIHMSPSAMQPPAGAKGMQKVVMPNQPGAAGEVMQKVRGGEAMNKATPVLMIPGAAETSPPEKAGEVLKKTGIVGPTDLQGKGAPGGAEEKGIIIINGKPFMPAPQGASMGPGGAEEKGIIIINNKPFVPAPQGSSIGPGSAEEKGIIIVNSKPGKGAAGDTVPTESLSLNYEKVKGGYVPQGQGGNVETEFKVEKGE